MFGKYQTVEQREALLQVRRERLVSVESAEQREARLRAESQREARLQQMSNCQHE